MVFDNRYLPLIQKPYISIYDRPSHLYFDLFFVTASSAFGYEENSDAEIGIPQLFGKFDQAALGQAMITAGYDNPLPLVLQKARLPWLTSGKIQTEGFSFSSYIELSKHLGVGLYWMAMRSNSRTSFNLLAGDVNIPLTDTDAVMLDDVLREMFQNIGLSCGFANQIGMGDLDLYARYHWERDFAYKFRHFDIGLRLGALIPTGEQKELGNPSSIPFGGNGFYGIYGAFDSEFEVREDWKLGFWLRASKRFKRTKCVRFPLNNVSLLFSPVRGNASINPGATLAFLPFFYAENIREGFGMGVQYTLIKHWADKWVDMRANKTPEVFLNAIDQMSAWSSDYLSLTLFYDFDKVKTDRGFAPIAVLTWDIPMDLILAEGAVKAHKVALGVQFNF